LEIRITKRLLFPFPLLIEETTRSVTALQTDHETCETDFRVFPFEPALRAGDEADVENQRMTEGRGG